MALGSVLHPRIIAYIKYEKIREEWVGKKPNQRKMATYRGKGYNCYGFFVRAWLFYLYDGETVEVGVCVDNRNLQLLKMGCCPPELGVEILEGFE